MIDGLIDGLIDEGTGKRSAVTAVRHKHVIISL